MENKQENSDLKNKTLNVSTSSSISVLSHFCVIHFCILKRHSINLDTGPEPPKQLQEGTLCILDWQSGGIWQACCGAWPEFGSDIELGGGDLKIFPVVPETFSYATCLYSAQ